MIRWGYHLQKRTGRPIGPLRKGRPGLLIQLDAYQVHNDCGHGTNAVYQGSPYDVYILFYDLGL